MSGSAADPFFWNDWQGDPLLRLCSFAAQGFWMRLLCICAESTRKGHLLVNGSPPSNDQLHKITGAPLDQVALWLEELRVNGVSSITRQGIIFNRKMVRDAKKRAASSKGGKIGGRVTHEKQTGIFTTQATTQDNTQGATQHPRRAPSPSPIPITHQKEEILESSFLPEDGNGKKNGNGTTTIADPHERLARFQAKLASHLGPRGWEIVASAAERTDPDHDRNLALCKAAANDLGKGWPKLWA